MSELVANQPAVDIIAQALTSSLHHPGDDKTAPVVIPLPMFRTNGIPPEAAAHFAQEAGLPHANIAQLTAEAIVHTLQAAGKDVIDTAELSRLRQADAVKQTDRKREVALECNCGATLVKAAMTEVTANKFTVYGGRFLAAVQAVHPDCALGHRAPA